MCVKFDTKVAKKYLQIKQSASSRGIDFDLSLTSIRNILKSKRCAYTGDKLNHTAGDRNQLTVDRVDNSIGYVTGNVVACADWFNQIKGQVSVKEAELIIKTHRKRGIK